MNSKNFKRLANRLSLLNRCKLGLQLFESNNYLVCLSKDFCLNPDYTESLTVIDDECYVKGLYYSGRVLQKKILMIPPEKFDENTMEKIISKQLKKKAQYLLNKWIHKAQKRLIYNYDLIHKKDTQIKKWYENEESLSEKQFIKEVRKKIKEQKDSEWVEFYKIKIQTSDDDTLKSKNSKKINKTYKHKDEVKKLIKSHFEKRDICELGEFSMVAQQTGLEALSEETYMGICDECFKKTNRHELEQNRKILNNEIVQYTSATQTENLKPILVDQCTQTSFEKDFSEKQIQTNDWLKFEEVKQSRNIGIQCSLSVKTKQKIDKILSEIDTDNVLGSPFNKRTNELETVYDEINSVLKKAKKSTSNLLIETPPVTYIGYSGFNLMTELQQQELLDYYKQHAKSLKHIVKLRNIGLSKETENLFLIEMRNDDNIISNINNLINNFKQEITQSEINDAKNSTDEFDLKIKESIILMSQSQELMEGHTPQEGNEQPLNIDDTLIEDLMTSFSV